jgi:hypothetical protein
MKFLLGQLANNGDCLYATILARQIRNDYPDAHVTWAISDKCKAIPLNNPDVDDIWVFPMIHAAQVPVIAKLFQHEALKRLEQGEFDHVLYSQIWPDNFQNFDGTVRPSILRSYGRKITVPIENVLHLTDAEIENVKNFVINENLFDFDHRILFECSSTSGQSFVTPDLSQEIAALVYEELPSATVILSSNLMFGVKHRNTRSAGKLSLREIAALTKACTLFVGSGSGCTVAATSTAATPLPMIQLLAHDTSVFASFAHDFAYYGKPNDHIVEIIDERPETIASAIVTACKSGISEAKARFHHEIEPTFVFYASLVTRHLLEQNRFIDAGRSAMLTADRYGWKPDLMDFAIKQIMPHLPKDPQWAKPDGKRDAEALIERLREAAGEVV